MFYPESGNNEFIEIYNLAADTINVNNFKIKYYTSNPDTIVDAGCGTKIPPSAFAVIFESDYDFASGIYKNIIPPNVIVLKIKDNAFGSNGMANTTDRTVSLLDVNNNIIDSYTYSANNPVGYSDEKILLAKGSQQNNWRNSLVINGTPGFKNSVTPLDYDIAIDSLSFNPQSLILGQSIKIKAKIKNNGLVNVDNFKIDFYDDLNNNLLPDENELIKTVTIQNLNFSDSVYIEVNYIPLTIGTRNIIAAIDFPNDENLVNNKFLKIFSVSNQQHQFNDVLINEIMFEPDNGEPEWVELFNQSSSAIDLSGWSINDVYTTPVTKKIQKNISIPAKSYLVLTNDSSIINYHRNISSQILKMALPVLNNDKDGVVLKDSLGILIDSMMYSTENKIKKGFSIERVEPSASSILFNNWGQSLDIEQSTPGRINSLTHKQYDLSLKEISFNPKYPVNGDNVFVCAKIANNGASVVSNYFVEFYYSSENYIDNLFLLCKDAGGMINVGDSVIVTSSLPINNLQNKIKIACKIIYEPDEDTLNNYYEKYLECGYAKNALVINEIMYAPENGEPEWFELQNVSLSDTLNLKNWYVIDVLPSRTKTFISTSDLFLMPQEFLIITKDPTFNNFYPNCNSKIKVINFGTLGNSEDGIIICDFRDAIIDSVFYYSSWGGKNGFSLERISTSLEGNDSTNWVTSFSENNATPGEVNSIVNVRSYKKNDLVINEIMYEPADDNCEFIELLNIGNSDVELGGWMFQNKNSQQIKLSEKNILLPPGSYYLVAADSSLLTKYSLQSNKYIKILNANLNLANTGGSIILKDAKGNLIDSVFYSPKWHNKNFLSTKNISLEKINPYLDGNLISNWSSSSDALGATPTRKNSIYTVNTNFHSKISIAPNPFSPDNDGYEDFTVINYNLSNSVSQVRIRIFDSKGRLVRTLLNNQPSGESGSVIFNGLDESGHSLRIGIYIILLEALGINSNTVETIKAPVVVARKFN
jgi:hypothetical protein